MISDINSEDRLVQQTFAAHRRSSRASGVASMGRPPVSRWWPSPLHTALGDAPSSCQELWRFTAAALMGDALRHSPASVIPTNHW